MILHFLISFNFKNKVLMKFFWNSLTKIIIYHAEEKI